MSNRNPLRSVALSTLLLLLLGAAAVGLLASPVNAQDPDLVTQVVWGKDSGETWKFESSDDVGDLGTTMAEPEFDDSAWGTFDFQYSANPGSGFANYFRKDFVVDDLYKVVGIELEFQYDDAAILYLNGQEVYRTIRGNLPPAPDPVPADITVPYGGFENYYVQIPGENNCQQGCGSGTVVDAVDHNLLVEGTNTWAIAVWNRTGSTDMSADLVFKLVIDRNAAPPAPCVDPVADQQNMLADDVSVALNLTCSDGDVTWAAQSLPDGLSINAAGVIVGQPTAIGAFAATVTVTDARASTEVPVLWTISNAPPAITNPGPQQTASFEAVDLQVVGTDPDGGAVEFSAAGLPPGLTMSTAGRVTGSSSAEGAYTVEISASDDEGETVTVSFAWQIAEPPITLESPGPQSDQFGVAVSLQIVASDPAGGTITLGASGLPPGLSVDQAANRIVGTPAEVGDYTVVLEGTGQSGRAIVSFAWSIPNELPVVAAIADQIALEGIATSVMASASDPDGGDIVFGANGLPAGLSVDPVTGLISGTPSDNGTFMVSVVATDDEGGRSTEDFTWNVAAALASPVLINEFVASNDTSLLDEDDDSPDWIELHNVAPVALDLDGWVLSDSTTSWTFPAVTMQPGTYLIVFASDKDRRVPGAPLHTNFKLSKEADGLTLIDAGGFVIDDFPSADVPQQFADVSYGRGADGSVFYLETATPGSANSAIGANYAPILRPFTDRLYNVGDPINNLIDAFDPDAGPLSYSMAPLPPGLQIDITSGLVTGTAVAAGVYTSEILVIDLEGKRQIQEVRWIFRNPPTTPAKLVLNEYNAVPPTSQLVAGEDPAFGLVDGNGGDWFEFVVVQDNLDLRGWTIELWDRDNGDALLKNSANLTFAARPELASLMAGTIITVSQDRADDLSFDPDAGDWHINLQSNDDDAGAFFTPGSQESFNSSRANQNVILRDPQGRAESPIVGETELWDELVGGVGDGEVMSYCKNPGRVLIDPIDDYLDNSEFSSYGAPNTCRFINDPLDVDDDVVVTQDFTAVRESAARFGVALTTSCLAENGRFDIVLRNSLDIAQTAGIEVTGVPTRFRVVPPGATVVESVTGRRDGPYAVTVRVEAVLVLSEAKTVKCDPPILVSCLRSNGRVDIRVENNIASEATYVVRVGTVTRSISVPAGGTDVVTVTGRPDGPIDVTISTSGVVVFGQTVTVDCDPDVELLITDGCLESNGRINASFTNVGIASATYVLSVGALSPRSITLAPQQSGRISVTGRADGPLPVSVSRDDLPIFSKIIDIECDSVAGGDGPVSVAVSCLSGNGRVDVNLFNDGVASTRYAIEVGALTRSATLAPGVSTRQTVTGRPDGPLQVTVRRDGQVVFDQSVTIACD